MSQYQSPYQYITTRNKAVALVIIFTIILSINNIIAQNIGSNFSVNLKGSIYAKQEDKSSLYILSPVPQLEVLYRLYNYKKLSIHTGLQYSYNHWNKDLGIKSEWRRKTHELALPFLINQEIGKYISLESGANIGYLLKGKMEYRNNIPAHPKWQDITHETDYNESSRIYMELFFTPKLKYDFDDWNTIALGPIIKHNIIEHWMEDIRPKTMYGFTLKYIYSF